MKEVQNIECLGRMRQVEGLGVVDVRNQGIWPLEVKDSIIPGDFVL